MSGPDSACWKIRQPRVPQLDQSARRCDRLPHFPLATFMLICATLCASLRADTISGTIKDPSGAVVARARIEISGGDLTTPTLLTTDQTGKFAAPNLRPGKYLVRVAKEGFDEIVSAVELHGTSDLQFGLTIAAQQTSKESTATQTSKLGCAPRLRHP